MRSSWAERRVGPAAALGAAGVVGVLVGLAAPPLEPTTALLTSTAVTTVDVGVAPCSDAHDAALAALGPVHHRPFAPGDVPAPTVPPPGLLVCSSSGALALSGGAGEGHVSPMLGLPATGWSAVLWIAPGATTAPRGTVVSVDQVDGRSLALVLEAGVLSVVEVAMPGGPASVLLTAGLPVGASVGDPVHVALARGATRVELFVDGGSVGTAPATPPQGTAPASATVRVGAAPGAVAATAVVDEVALVPHVLDAAATGTLVAARRW